MKALRMVIPILIAVMAIMFLTNYEYPKEPIYDREIYYISKTASVKGPVGSIRPIVTPEPIIFEPLEEVIEVIPEVEEEAWDEPEIIFEETYEEVAEEPEEIIEVAQDESSLLYLGVWTATGYCQCEECCGQWSGGPTASGAWPTSGHTVACSAYPFGTRLLINGQEYVVEDLGVYGEWVDIFFDTHEEALTWGMQDVEVYLIG